ncbi:MAG TPA: sucrase ferredoxin [Thermomicrobiales bacterium]|nr:sucrase ferredoxin [Thermomicrobiales bacterium]
MIGFAPDDAYRVDGMRRIIDMQQPAEVVANSYRRTEYLVPQEGRGLLLRLLAFKPNHPRVAELRTPVDPAARDLLICTRGTVDACCATFGYPIYKLLRAMADGAPNPTRAWRCTHFGGHRFAATALDLPTGRYWGHLNPETLSKLVHRSAPMRDVRRHYRGWAALSERLWQIAEAELSSETGWM